MQLTYLNYRNVQETVAKFEERKLFAWLNITGHHPSNNISSSAKRKKPINNNNNSSSNTSSSNVVLADEGGMHIILPVSVQLQQNNNNNNNSNSSKSADNSNIKFEVVAQVGIAKDIIFEKHDVVNNIMNSSPVVKLTITNTTTTTTVSSTATNSNNNNTDIDVVNVILQSLIANLKEIISKIFIEFENSIKFDPIHSGSLFIIIDTSINILLII